MKLSEDLSLVQPAPVACIPRALCCVPSSVGFGVGEVQKEGAGLGGVPACALRLGLVH